MKAKSIRAGSNPARSRGADRKTMKYVSVPIFQWTSRQPVAAVASQIGEVGGVAWEGS